MIKNWWQLVHNETNLLNTNAEIQCQPEDLEYARFKVGFKSFHNGSTDDARLYWKLLSKHDLLHKVEASVVIMNLPKVLCYSKTREFKKACKDDYKENMVALLSHKLSSDTKILTKDKTELFAHKAILSGILFHC